ncbi:MAG: hypothetical protein ACI9WU_000224 [Myxococcota bacterium]|jgi:hypothetical protein
MARWITLAVGITLLVGCTDDLFGSSGIQHSDCSISDPTAQVDGTWVISGSGARKDCSADELNTDLFTLSATLPMVADLDGKLSLNADLATAGVDFSVDSGDVAGSCVTVSFREDDLTAQPNTSTVTKFVATGTGTTIRGDFTQDGPGDCRAEGTFLATIQ